MHRNMNISIALARFRRLALWHDDNFQRRFDWTPRPPEIHDPTDLSVLLPIFSGSEIDAIYTEIINKIPAGATKVLELGCGDGRFYRALKAAKPSIDYQGIDLVPENITEAQTAKGTITCAGVLAADTVTIDGVTLTASGSQTAAGLDFNESGPDAKVARSLVAAINDSGNGLNGSVTASNNNGRSAVVTLRAVAIGTAANSTALASSEGIRLAVSGATLADGQASGLFSLGNAWEYLAEAPVDWDFVVSINCLFDCTAERGRNILFDLLDAKSAEGFFVLVGHPSVEATWLDPRMLALLTASTNVVESYYTGARAFLDDSSVLKGRYHPFYVHRDSTSTTTPTLERRYCPITTGRYNDWLGRSFAKSEAQAGRSVPTEVPGVVATGGLVTGASAITLTADQTKNVVTRVSVDGSV